MAGEVYVSVSALEQLDSSLFQTQTMLERVVLDARSSADKTLQQIDLYLDNYNAAMSNAYHNYEQARSNLAYAQRNDDDVPFYYYEAVNAALAEYNRLTDCFNRIKNIKETFTEQNNILQRSIADERETYLSILKKSGAFIEKYTELINQSNRAVDNGGYSLSANRASQKTNISNGSAEDIASIKGWLPNINPNFSDPFTPDYRFNCGSCAFAVESRLNGINIAAVASAKNIGKDEEMEQATSKKCVYMPVADIARELKIQGPGSHFIVGINRRPTPQGKGQAGHWFNAYYDGNKIYTIDGQSGEVLDWPYDYGDISEWCALV